MDVHRFDALTRALTSGRSRRGALALLGSVFATPFFGASPAVARKKKTKKVTICRDGQSLSVSKKKLKQQLGSGATLGECTSPPPPPPLPPPTCTAESCDGLCEGCRDGACVASTGVTCGTGHQCLANRGCARLCTLNPQCGMSGGMTCYCGVERVDGPTVCLVRELCAATPLTCETTADCPEGSQCNVTECPAPVKRCLQLC